MALESVNDKQNATRVPTTDAGGWFTATDAEATFQEIGANYAYRPGRSGGQTLYGGTAAADNLTLWPNTVDPPTDLSTHGKINVNGAIKSDEKVVVVCGGVTRAKQHTIRSSR